MTVTAVAADGVVTDAAATDAAWTVSSTADAVVTASEVGAIELAPASWLISEFQTAYTGSNIATFEGEFASVASFQIASERP